MPWTTLICDDLEKWIEDRPKCESPWTKKNLAQTIKRPFSWAWKKGLAVSNPLYGVSYSKGERGKPMTELQFRMILRDVQVDFRRVLLFLWWTGCRPSELCALKWSHIDSEKPSPSFTNDKTAHSSKAPRTIYLPGAKLCACSPGFMADQPQGRSSTCSSAKWASPAAAGDLSRRICRARLRLGIPASCRLYGCRHSSLLALPSSRDVPLKTRGIDVGRPFVGANHGNLCPSPRARRPTCTTLPGEKGLGRKG